MKNMKLNDALKLRDLLTKVDDELNNLYFSNYDRFIKAITNEDAEFYLIYVNPIIGFLDIKTNIHYLNMFITSNGGCKGILFIGYDNGTFKTPIPILFEDLDKLSNNDLANMFV